MKFRRKTFVIEAEQYSGQRMDCLEYNYDNDPRTPDKVQIKTNHGLVNVSRGDWIITGLTGEKYPCSNEIFEQSYEKVEE